MDVDKLKKWLDVAQQFQGDNFWSDIFDQTNQPNQTNQQNMGQTPPNPRTSKYPNQSSPEQSSPESPAPPNHQHQSRERIPSQSQQGTPPSETNDQKKAPQPAVDIFESDREWIIWIDLPGVKKEEIQLHLVGRKLVIKGVAHLPFPNETLVHSERLNGTFERHIAMPENLGSNAQPAAKFENGVLEVRLPRESPKKHHISID